MFFVLLSCVFLFIELIYFPISSGNLWWLYPFKRRSEHENKSNGISFKFDYCIGCGLLDSDAGWAIHSIMYVESSSIYGWVDIRCSKIDNCYWFFLSDVLTPEPIVEYETMLHDVKGVDLAEAEMQHILEYLRDPKVCWKGSEKTPRNGL